MAAAAPALVSAYLHRSLIRRLVGRELAARYRGAALGQAWPLISPLLMLAVFTLVFGAVFRSRWPDQADQGLLSFALVLFAGLLAHAFMAEMLSSAPAAILENPNYVKKVVFPLETLAWVRLGVAGLHAAVGYCLLVAVNAVLGSGLHLSAVAIPFILLPFSMLLVGLHWWLSAIGVFLRDLGQLVAPMLTALMFLSPVFYPRSQAPPPLDAWIVVNPLTVPIEQVRGAIFAGQWPDLFQWGCYLAVSLLVFASGLFVFQKLRKGFADVV